MAAGETVNHALLTAIRGLPTRQREVIALRIFRDLDPAVIARQLGIEAGTVRMHMSQAIAALRRDLVPDTTTEAQQ
jgi:RNA polymerase sigma factor (sigma-70 family)